MSYPDPVPAAPAAPARIAVTGLVCPSPPTGELFELAVSSRTASDGHFRFVWTLAPGKTGPGEHVHEDETESFEVVSGTLRIWISDVPTDFTPGDTVAIPPNTPHRFLNPGSEPVVVNVALSGPRMEDMLAPIAVATRGRSVRMNDLLRMLVGLLEYRSSTPVRAFERRGMQTFVWFVRLFGVRRFEPVLGWDSASG